MTLSDFYKEVLEHIGQNEAGQTPSSTDTAKVSTVYSLIHALLQRKGLTTWGASDDVPDWAAISMKHIVAYECAGSFPVNEQKKLLLEKDYKIGLDDLVENTNQDWSEQTIEAEYF